MLTLITAMFTGAEQVASYFAAIVLILDVNKAGGVFDRIFLNPNQHNPHLRLG